MLGHLNPLVQVVPGGGTLLVLCLATRKASGASTYQLVADVQNLEVNPGVGQFFADDTEGMVGVTVLVRASVDGEYFHNGDYLKNSEDGKGG